MARASSRIRTSRWRKSIDACRSLTWKTRPRRRSDVLGVRRLLRHARPCAGHPRLGGAKSKTWMAGTKPGHDKEPTSSPCDNKVWVDPAMKLSEYLKPALGVALLAAAGIGYYWFEHRPPPDEKETP